MPSPMWHMPELMVIYAVWDCKWAKVSDHEMDLKCPNKLSKGKLMKANQYDINLYCMAFYFRSSSRNVTVAFHISIPVQ